LKILLRWQGGLVNEVKVTFDDEKRAELTRQATAEQLKDLPHLYMIQYHSVFATRPGIQGLTTRFDENFLMDPISKSE